MSASAGTSGPIAESTSAALDPATRSPVAEVRATASPHHESTINESPTGPATQQASYSAGSVRPATWNDLSWRQAAACANVPTETFFPVGLTGEATIQTRMAKRVCASCPVQPLCLEFSLRTNQDHGIWGGYTEEERRTIRRARRAAARKAKRPS
jgi:WhiB family transcriptional regulator, redox-sensing transcriptional regulator